MAYNKKQNLNQNIEAIQLAFELERYGRPATENERVILSRYNGFGGLKCILYHENDKSEWNKSDLPLYDDIQKLFNLIRDNSSDYPTYHNYVKHLENSVTTAFYTPEEVVNAIAKSFNSSGITPTRLLDPSAGTGIFLQCNQKYTNPELYAFEKDLITGKVLRALYPSNNIQINGFETIQPEYNNYFDVITSNIPFGNLNIYDPGFNASNDPVKKISKNTLHNYFFVKSVDCLRDGGVLAFITSRGVMDSPGNKEIRSWLMHKCDLVTAIRLPDSLFNENANTQVGTDLIILQKNTTKKHPKPIENEFIETRQLKSETYPDGVEINNYFWDLENIIYTRAEMGKDPYGKPTMQFFYDGTYNELGENLNKIITRDLKKFFDLNLYNKHLPDITPPEQQPEQNTNQPSFSLHDLFEITPNERIKQNKQRSRLPPKKKYLGIVLEHYKPGTLVIDEQRVGILGKVVAPDIGFEEIKVSIADQSLLEDYLKVRDSYYKLLIYESTEEKENKELRKELNVAYNDFVSKYGDLNSKKPYQSHFIRSFRS